MEEYEGFLTAWDKRPIGHGQWRMLIIHSGVCLQTMGYIPLCKSSFLENCAFAWRDLQRSPETQILRSGDLVDPTLPPSNLQNQRFC